MKKVLAIMLTVIMTVVSSPILVFADESVPITDEQRILLNDEVEIPGVATFNITSVELTEAEDDGWQQLDFTIHFQNLTPNIIDLGEFMEWELSYLGRFVFELSNPEDFEDAFFRPLVARNVILSFILPDAALEGDYDTLILSLSFAGSEDYHHLDVLDALELAAEGAGTMDTPVFVLGRNNPLMTPGVWMNTGDFAIRVDGVLEYDSITGMPTTDGSERFLRILLTIRNFTLAEQNVADLATAELVFRETFVFEYIDVSVGREILAPLEDTAVYITFLAPNLLFDSEDEELWVLFNIGGVELATEVREIMEEGGDLPPSAVYTWADILDSTTVSFEHPPLNMDGVMFVSLRDFVEPLGAVIDWDSAAQTATVTLGNLGVILQSGNSAMYAFDLATEEEQVITLTEAPTLIFGSMIIPIEVILSAFGYGAEWDDSGKVARLVAHDYLPEDVAEPELTPVEVTMLGRDITPFRLERAVAFTRSEPGHMMGAEYIYGFRTSGEWTTAGSAFYNIGGRYTTMTFLAGPMDNIAPSNTEMTFTVLGDGQQLAQRNFWDTTPVISFVVDVTGVTQLEFRVNWRGNSSNFFFGVANATLTTEGDPPAEALMLASSANLNTPTGRFNETAILGRDIPAYRFIRAQAISASQPGHMMGVAYTDGFRTTGEWTTSGWAFYNINGQYSTMTGTFGPMDNAAIGATATLTIWGNGWELATYDMRAGDPTRQFSVDVEGVHQIRFRLQWSGNSSDRFFGVTDIQVHQ